MCVTTGFHILSAFLPTCCVQLTKETLWCASKHTFGSPIKKKKVPVVIDSLTVRLTHIPFTNILLETTYTLTQTSTGSQIDIDTIKPWKQRHCSDFTDNHTTLKLEYLCNVKVDEQWMHHKVFYNLSTLSVFLFHYGHWASVFDSCTKVKPKCLLDVKWLIIDTLLKKESSVQSEVSDALLFAMYWSKWKRQVQTAYSKEDVCDEIPIRGKNETIQLLQLSLDLFLFTQQTSLVVQSCKQMPHVITFFSHWSEILPKGGVFSLFSLI